MNLTLSIHFFFTDEMNLETNPRSDSIETELLEEGGVHNGEDSFLLLQYRQ